MRASILLLLLLALGACQMPEAPGELVGEYAITGELTENTCGDEALPVANVLSYHVELRRDGATAYWLIGAPPANQGVFTSSGDIRFEREEHFTVRDEAQPVDPVLAEMDPINLFGYDPFDPEAEPDDGVAPCTLIVRESIDGTVLDDGDSDTDPDHNIGFEGTNTIEMRATADSECRRVLQSAGGPFEQLPCAATYQLSGELLSTEDE